jgi:purine-nucleoside phosphorylase
MEKIPPEGFSRVERCRAMPKRLRPTAPLAPDVVLVGDPGRALLLAQELLDEPKMSNHARGLWGYSGRTAGGERLTIQSTGMGGPSAAVVLVDLAKLGVRRAVRIGTCMAVAGSGRPGDLIAVDSARAEGASAASFGVATGEPTLPDLELGKRLLRELPKPVSSAAVASFDRLHADSDTSVEGIAVTDMQTATVLACGRALGIAVAAVLIVETTGKGERISDDELERAAKRAGQAAAASLSP